MAARVPPHCAPAGRLTWLALAALLTAVCWAHPGRGLAAQQPAPDKARPEEMKKPELYQLTNDELVKQAGALWEKMSRDYLAQRRALATAEALLDDVRRQTELVKSVAPAPADDPIKKAVDAARAKQDAANRKLKLVQSQKELLGRVATGVEGC